MFGDVILVNGAPWPVVEVSATRHRLRVLNASNARRYDLALDPPPPASTPTSAAKAFLIIIVRSPASTFNTRTATPASGEGSGGLRPSPFPPSVSGTFLRRRLQVGRRITSGRPDRTSRAGTGEVAFDEHGVNSTGLTTALRLLDAVPLKAVPLKKALVDSPGVSAVIVSRLVFDRRASARPGDPGLGGRPRRCRGEGVELSPDPFGVLAPLLRSEQLQ